MVNGNQSKIEYDWETWRSLLRVAYIMNDKEALAKLIEEGPEEKETYFRNAA